MKKILVFSDSHGSTEVMRALLSSPPEGLAAVFHLGDGAAEAEALMRHYPMYAFIGVRGNCDGLDTGRAETVYTERGGVRFMLTHGHCYGVKSSLGAAAAVAASNGAEVLLYGHTHIQAEELIETSDGAVYAINSGSVRCGSYALLCVDNGAVSAELMRYGSDDA